MPSQGSPTESSRAGRDAIVNWSGWMSSISAQASGVDTCAPGRARTDQAPNTVLCGAFWLKSMNTRWPRSSFHHAAVVRSGRRHGRGADLVGIPARLQPQVDVQAPVAGGLGTPGQAEFGEQPVHLVCRPPDVGE